MSERITWTQGRYGTVRGSVNGLDLFTLNRGTSRSAPGWNLTTEVPGQHRTFSAEDEAELKDLAERILIDFVKRIGARF